MREVQHTTLAKRWRKWHRREHKAKAALEQLYTMYGEVAAVPANLARGIMSIANNMHKGAFHVHFLIGALLGV